MNTDPQTRILLLVEDNPGDAALVSDLLTRPDGDHFLIVRVANLAEAVTRLRETPVDVVVLDLRLPDCAGVDTVKMVREAAGQTPIVVLTGTDDEQLALACIDAGAQDYLAKSELRTQSLRRAIGYAITRLRETQMRELSRTLEQYRALSSAAQGTSVTAALVGSGAVALRSPQTFAALVDGYGALLERSAGSDDGGPSRAEKEKLATALGDAGGGPRDLLDVHVAALERMSAASPDPRSLVFEARLIALEMMGLLVDYYRVGHRRRFVEGVMSC